MKSLIILILGLVAIGCGKQEQTTTEKPTKPLTLREKPELSEVEKLEEENRRMEAQLKNDKLKAELEAEEKKRLRDSVIGEYVWRYGTDTIKHVYLENGIRQTYLQRGTNSEKVGSEDKWSIVDGEIYSISDNGSIYIHRINADKSITLIAIISLDGKRTTQSMETAWIKIK